MHIHFKRLFASHFACGHAKGMKVFLGSPPRAHLTDPEISAHSTPITCAPSCLPVESTPTGC